MAQRGEDRLARLVEGWYFPASYGGVRGVLTDEEATLLVTQLEAEIPLAEIAPPVVEHQPAHREANCELCGAYLGVSSNATLFMR